MSKGKIDAQRYADKINVFWRRRGVDANARIEPQSCRIGVNAMCIWNIVSDLTGTEPCELIAVPHIKRPVAL